MSRTPKTPRLPAVPQASQEWIPPDMPGALSLLMAFYDGDEETLHRTLFATATLPLLSGLALLALGLGEQAHGRRLRQVLDLCAFDLELAAGDDSTTPGP